MAARFTEAFRRLNGWRVAAIVLAVLLVFALQTPAPSPATSELTHQLVRVAGQVHELQQEHSMPMLVLDRHRDSICFLYGIYSFRGPDGRVRRRMRISGTGFVVAKGLVATNRHVAEPWFEDDEAEALIRRGATPHLDKLLAFFPNRRDGIDLTGVHVPNDADLAVARFTEATALAGLQPLPLSQQAAIPGDSVVVVGYPMGTVAMVAKSPQPVYRRLAYRSEGLSVARELAARSLIRPSATNGHLGDVVGDKLIYDAVTAHGGSGGPVFDSHGRVIGVNAAYLDGFSGSTLGISVDALRPLIAAAERKR
jgi:S1-C subfamily serine protease